MTRRGARRVGIAIALALSRATLAFGDELVLRDGLGSIAGSVTRVGPEGIAIQPESGGEVRTIEWTRIANAQLSDGALAAAAKPWLDAADGLWRGAQRLARGDCDLARQAFDASRAQFLDAPGPSGLLAAEGLLRAKLCLGAGMDDPAESWALALRVDDRRRRGERVETLDGLGEPLDALCGAVPELPPYFSPRSGAGSTDSSAELAALTVETAEARALAARVTQLARPGTPRVAPVRDEMGTPEWRGMCELLDRWAEALQEDASKRKRARQRLEQLTLESAWLRAWAHVARAQSLEREPAASAADEAILAFVTAAEVSREESPRLSAWCAVRAGALLRAAGDAAAAERVESTYGAVVSAYGRSD